MSSYGEQKRAAAKRNPEKMADYRAKMKAFRKNMFAEPKKPERLRGVYKEENDMENIDHVANLVANVKAKNMIGAEQDFNLALQDRLETALDVRRREIAGAIYGGKPADITAEPEDVETEEETIEDEE